LGWSTGGATAITFAARFPECVDKVVLLCAISPKGVVVKKDDGVEVCRTKEEIRGNKKEARCIEAFQNGEKEFFRKVFEERVYNVNKPGEEEFEGWLEDTILQRNYVDILYANQVFNVTSEENEAGVKGNGDAGRVKARTLVIGARKDKAVPVGVTEEWKKWLGDGVKVRIIENSGHAPVVDALGELSEMIVSFVMGKE